MTAIDTLRRVPLFNELSSEELGRIAASVTVSQYDSGQIIFHEGDKGGDLLMVQQGAVRVVKTSAGGREQLIAIERAGSSLGEVSVFDGGKYSTTAAAVEPTVLLRLGGEKFRALCLSNPEGGFQSDSRAGTPLAARAEPD